jgi:hypothetical protein
MKTRIPHLDVDGEYRRRRGYTHVLDSGIARRFTGGSGAVEPFSRSLV